MGLACLWRIYNAWLNPVSERSAQRVASSRCDSTWSGRLGDVRFELQVEQPDAAHSSKPADIECLPDAMPTSSVATTSAASSPQPYWLRLGYSTAARFVVCLLIAFLVFRIAMPYAFSGPGFFGFKLNPAWLKDLQQWEPTLRGRADSYPSHQWASRTPIVYTLVNMLLWTMGVPLSLAAWAGWALAWYELLRQRRLQHALLLAWTTVYFFYFSTQFIKNSRYMVPLNPFMAILGAYLLVRLWDHAKSSVLRWAKPAALAVALFVIVGNLLWAFAFTRIYTRPLTRVTASLWAYDNIPAGSAITYESWDDAIPWGGVGGRNGFADGTYIAVETHPYAEDSSEKLEWFVDWTSKADYIILSSNRLYASIPRLPMRYPMTTRYYKYLFSGELGFDLIKTFTSRPNLGPIEFVDDNADESFTVYDHPKVLVFKKRADFSAEKVRSLLGDGIDWDNIARLLPIQVSSYHNGLQMTDAEQTTQRAGGTWSQIFNRQSVSNALPVLFWLLLVEVLGVITLPWGYLVFRGLADRGYILCKTLGILLLTWLTWMMVNLHITGYSRSAIGIALLLLTATSAGLFWRKRDEMAAFWKQNQRLIIVNEALFLLFFLGFLAIRYGNPDLWHQVMGGEKPMDFAYLNAVIRSSTFPPYDPWYAGGYLNYYYFGQIIVATLIKFTGIVPWVGYNLAIPLLAALTAMGAFCATYNLTHKAGLERKGWWQREFTWGLLAALMVAVLGNLGEIAVWLRALQDISRVDARSSFGLVTSIAKVLSGLSQWITGHAKPSIRPEWPYWNPSRVMPNGEINEFPFFTFLYADLHAHLIALPFGLLTLGMAVSIVRQKRRHNTPDMGTASSPVASPRQSWTLWVGQAWCALTKRLDWGDVLSLAALALVIGALRCINSWDYPTYLLVTGIALVLREYEQRGRIDLAGVWAVAWRSAMVFVLSTLLFQPFLSRFSTAYVAFERWKGPRTGLDAYLIIHGLFLFAFISWMGCELFSRESRGGVVRALRLALRHWERLPRLLNLYRRLVKVGREFELTLGSISGLVVLLLAWLLKSREWFYLFVVLLILGTLLVVLRWRMEPRRRFVWLLFGVGLLLSLGVDLFVLKGDIGRMNTVFKFYLQLWVFWAVGAAVALSEMSERARTWSAHRRRLWWGMLALLIFLAALYPIYATRAKINDRYDSQVGPTLDGMAYMQRAVYTMEGTPIELKWDYAAINWLLDNVKGSPVIAECNTEERGLYRWGSRVSIYTGMPTILGWSWHQRQQRSAMPSEWIDRRLRDVTTLYRDTSIDATVTVLKRYDVRYIYVGDLERVYYPGAGLDKFEDMRAQGLLTLAYHNEHVQIYEVVKNEQ